MKTALADPAEDPLPAGSLPLKQDLKVAAVWAVAAGLAAAALTPYVAQMMPDKFAHLPVSLPVVAIAQGAQAAVLIGLMSLLGLRMGRRVALGSPLLHGWINLRRRADWRALRPLQAILLGVGTAVLVLGASALLDPMLPKMLHPPAKTGAAASALNGFLASFYGGIAEELQLRLFAMTLLVWIAAKLTKRDAQPAWMYWTAIAVAALLFGAGHLPAAHQVWGLDAFVAFRTVALNAIAGLFFGWLYWKRGLEMAVLAHFSADIVLHVLAPLIHSGVSA